LLKSEFDSLGADRFGAVKSGGLWLKCEALVGMTDENTSLDGDNCCVEHVSLPISVHWDFPGEAETVDECFILPVLQDSTQFVGLIVVADSKRQGCYRRTGHFATEGKTHLDQNIPFLSEPMASDELASLFVPDYEGPDGKPVD
jgi:hypothetical protein